MDIDAISRLYANVLHNDILVNRLQTKDIRAGVQSMSKAYSPEAATLESDTRNFPNFNDAAFRCAYLHKYASLHTFVVLDVMLRILRDKGDVFMELLMEQQRPKHFKFCCLGGGPGTDVIGVLAALQVAFTSFHSSVTVIDCMKEWEFSFSSILQELKFGGYGDFWRTLSDRFQWCYIGANLLQSMTSEVNKSIASANFVTMVKFLSAASCSQAEPMVEKIFRVMKPGAYVLYIDNAAGGFTQVIERASKKNNFTAIVPPQRHVQYENENFKIDRFGYTSCHKTTVTYLLLKKQRHRNARDTSPEPWNSTNYSSEFPYLNDNLSYLREEVDSAYLPQPLPSNAYASPGRKGNMNYNNSKKNRRARKPRNNYIRQQSAVRVQVESTYDSQYRRDSDELSDTEESENENNNDCSCCVIS